MTSLQILTSPFLEQKMETFPSSCDQIIKSFLWSLIHQFGDDNICPFFCFLKKRMEKSPKMRTKNCILTGIEGDGSEEKFLRPLLRSAYRYDWSLFAKRCDYLSHRIWGRNAKFSKQIRSALHPVTFGKKKTRCCIGAGWGVTIISLGWIG